MSSTSSSLKTASKLACSTNSRKRSLFLRLCFYRRSSQFCGANVMPLIQIHWFVSWRPTSLDLNRRKGSKKNHYKLDLLCQKWETISTFCYQSSSCPCKILWSLPQQNPPAGQRQEVFPPLTRSVSTQHWGPQLGKDMFLPDKVILGATRVNITSKA